MLSWLPEEPDVPAQQRAEGRLHLRYEDVAQDGHLVVEAMPNALGAVWRLLAADRRASLGAGPGVVAILSRVVLEVGEGPIAVMGPTEAQGRYQLAHDVGPDGEVSRVLLDMWASTVSVVGLTHGAPPADAGRPVVAGRVFAEHVFTRPFGPPAERKVRALELDGRAFVPEARRAFHPADDLLALPDGAAPLDEALEPDTASTVFGLDHTDGNQHINSLVYTRLFIEAALRRLDARGQGRPPRRAQSIEIAYRKPSFAGDRVRVLVRAFTAGAQPGAIAALVTDDEAKGPLALARPRVFARVLFGA